jgi:Na+/H+-dicarboxylate symporter
LCVCVKINHPVVPTPVWYADPYTEVKPGMNILGLVVFALVFGYFISILGPDGKPLADVFASLEKVIMKMVTMVIWLVVKCTHDVNK